jgi:hypothetical protein
VLLSTFGDIIASKNGTEDLTKVTMVYLDWLNKEVGNEKTMDVNIGSSCGIDNNGKSI